MRTFAYTRAGDIGEAIRAGSRTGQGQVDAATQYLAGGTTLIDLMKLDVLRPEGVVDIGPLKERYAVVEAGPGGLRLGALATMADVADHPVVAHDYPVIAQSLRFAASAQLRNMATVGGNVLQRTRCPYFRDTTRGACNKRTPGSGCAAMGYAGRNHAVLGVDDSCIAQYPGDFAVALAALDAVVDVAGPAGARSTPIEELHRPAGGAPHLETTLRPSELITGFRVASAPWTRRSLYLKIRDRESYEFALAAAAVAIDLEGEVVRGARIALGGCAYRPWRSRAAEAALTDQRLTEASARAAASAAMAGAVTHGANAFKPELVRRTLVRALLGAGRIQV